MTVFLRWLEAPLLDRFNRFGVETKSQTAYHANVPRISVFIHNQPEDAGSLSFCVARLFRVLRIRSRNRLRNGYPSADLIHTSADAAPAARANARPVAATHTAARSVADASARN